MAIDRVALMERLNLRYVLGGIRIGVGVKTWLAPRLALRVFGFGGIGRDPRVVVLARLFGVRDAAMGTALLVARTDEAALRAVEVGIIVDSADVAASVLSMRRRGSRITGLMTAAGAAFLAVLGVAVRQSLLTQHEVRPTAG